VPDTARYLARRSEDGYVSSASQGLPGEPEAVSEDEQDAITEQARMATFNERIKRRQATAAEIAKELTWAESRARYLRRELARLQRK
jgi:hypothetical protein